MISHIIIFLVMLNPFAMFLYLGPVMEELSNKSFRKVLFKASAISLGIFLIFLFSGGFLFEKVFQINFESFRIFGGIIIFSFAYLYIVRGQAALIHMKEDLDDLAEEIALPFMVGAGTISLSLLIGKELEMIIGISALVVILAVNFMIILFLKMLRDNMPRKKLKIAFDKNMGILLRLNGFFLGAIGVNMVHTGLSNLF
ncbi:MarC family protein [Candidatus Woesearchaeota archaeon]|nr:MarC family protein [Candidatus Woesearchaeota archaeon]